MKRATIALTIIGFFSQILGFTRELVLSNYYGISEVADAYLIVLTLQNFIISFVITSISLNFITYFKKIENQLSIKDSLKFTNNIFSILFIFLLFIAVFCYLFMGEVVSLLAHGFNKQTLDLSITFAKITIFSIIFCGLSYLLTAYLHANNKFNMAAFMGYPLNIIIIISILYSVNYGSLNLAYGFLAAYIIQFIFLLYISLANGLNISFKINLKDKYLKEMLIVAMPVIFVNVGYEVNTLIDKSMSSGVASGGVAILTYSERLVGSLYAIVVIPLMTILFPKIAESSISLDIKEINRILKNVINILFMILLPVSIYLFLFSKEIIEVIYGRGQFNEIAIQSTGTVFAIAIVGILFWGIRDICLRVYYALEKYKVVVIISVISVVLNLTLNVILSNFFGIYGIVMSTTIVFIISAVILLKKLEVIVGRIVDNKLKAKMKKVTIITLVVSISTYLIKIYLLQNMMAISILIISSAFYFPPIIFLYRKDYINSKKNGGISSDKY